MSASPRQGLRVSATAQGASVSRSPWALGAWILCLAAAGMLQAWSLAWPFSGPALAERLPGGYAPPLWWLQLASLALLAHGLRTALNPRQAALRAMVFASAWLAATFWWLFISMHTYGGLPAPLAVLAVAALAAFLGSYYALAAWVWGRLASARLGQQALLFAALWTLAELARGWLWTGFPWGAGAYAHVQGPLSMLPRWLGMAGTGAVAAWLAYWLAAGLAWVCALCMARRRGVSMPAACPQRAVRLGLSSLLVVALWGLAAWQRDCAVNGCAGQPLAQRPAMTVAMLQGNIPQDEKFESGSGIPLALSWYAQALSEASAQLVLAPETALPLPPQQLPEGYLSLISERYTRPGGQQAALLGIPLGSFERGFTNSVVAWAPGQTQSYQYDKHHLVPFGEFIPPLFRWFTEMMNIPLGDFNRGGLGQPSLHWAGERLSPNICYEDLFGEELAAHFGDAQTAPTVMVNFSNIGWFGDSVAIDQHLSISRMRALEFERPMLRVTNTGATVVIDHRGQVVQALAPHQRGVLQASVQGHDGLTPFARWAFLWGLWPLTGVCLAVVLWAWRRR